MPDRGVGALPELVETHRARQQLLRAQTILTQQMGAYCRRLCGGDKIEGARLLSAVEARLKLQEREHRALLSGRRVRPSKRVAPEHPALDVAAGVCLHLYEARRALRPGLIAYQKTIESMVRAMPIWTEWAEPILGLGALGLGQILGECIDPGRYPTHGKLWKRMGVGIVDRGGVWQRQRRVAGEEAALHGYNPERRSILYVVGSSIIKKRLSPYRAVYDAKRAEYEVTRPEWTKGHRHLAAQRHMEKKLLRDLWAAWRRTMLVAEGS